MKEEWGGEGGPIGGSNIVLSVPDGDGKENEAHSFGAVVKKWRSSREARKVFPCCTSKSGSRRRKWGQEGSKLEPDLADERTRGKEGVQRNGTGRVLFDGARQKGKKQPDR